MCCRQRRVLYPPRPEHPPWDVSVRKDSGHSLACLGESVAMTRALDLYMRLPHATSTKINASSACVVLGGFLCVTKLMTAGFVSGMNARSCVKRCML